MGDNRKEYEMAPSEDPENPAAAAEKTNAVDVDKSQTQQWSGLGKEELLRVADTPAWNWARNILLILFWVAWVLMLVVAIILVVKAPSCPNLEWHEKSVFYQVFVRSFKDSDGDGYGDLKGLTDNLKHLKDIGVDTVYVSSIFKEPESGSRDYGQDIVDFTEIDKVYGDLDDFDNLIDEIQTNGMHIVLEFVPNHSSDQHMWFLESQKNANNDYSDYYVWADGVGDGPPNSWVNVYGDSAWTKVPSRDQYYYHNLLPQQPDLNYNNENVTNEIKNAMAFWFDRKVDGFVFTHADFLLEGPIVTSVGKRAADMATEMTEVEAIPTAEPEVDGPDSDMGSGQAQYSHIGDGEGSLSAAMTALLGEFYDVVEENSYLGKFRILVPQHGGSIASSAMYQKEGWRGFPSSTDFAEQLDDSMVGHKIKDQIVALTDAKHKAGVPALWNSWMLGSSEMSRVATRTGPNARALLMLLFTLPGTPMPYYGEELGLPDLVVSETKDPVALADPSNEEGLSRDPQRGPYPWSAKSNGGFSMVNSTSPWLNVAEDLDTVNFAAQSEESTSHLSYFAKLADFHREPSLSAGDFNITNFSNDVFAFVRSFPEWPRYMVLCNFGDSEVSGVNLKLPVTEGSEVSSGGSTGTLVLSASGKMMGKPVELGGVTIGANDAYLILVPL